MEDKVNDKASQKDKNQCLSQRLPRLVKESRNVSLNTIKCDADSMIFKFARLLLFESLYPRPEKEPKERPSGSSRLHHQHCVLTGQRASLRYTHKHTQRHSVYMKPV